MLCAISAIVGIGLLGATFFTLFHSSGEKELITSSLRADLHDTYFRLVAERRSIYIQGLLLGIVLALFALQLFPTGNSFFKVALSLMVTLLVSAGYYKVMPKSDTMGKYLNSEKEIEAWKGVSARMQWRYRVGFVLGSLSAIPLAYTMC